MKETTLKEAIINLYIDLKNEEMMNKYDEATINEDTERLKKAEPSLLADYLRSAIEAVINQKSQKTIDALNKEIIAKADIEELLRKAESDIRNKIKIQQQLTLYCETLKQRANELEKSKNEWKQNCKSLQNKLNTKINEETLSKERKEREIAALTTEVDNLKKVLSSYENHNLKFVDLESKFRTEKTCHKEEIKRLEEKVQKLNQQIFQYEDALKAKSMTKANSQAMRVQNYIEEEEEITQVSHGNMTKIRSSSVTERPQVQQMTVSKKIASFRRHIEEYNSNMDRKLRIQAPEHKRSISKGNSNEFSDEYESVVLNPNLMRTSEVMNNPIGMKKLNCTNLNNAHSNNNHNSTDRTHRSTQSSSQYKDCLIAQDFIYNKRGANAKDSLICQDKEKASSVLNNRKI